MTGDKETADSGSAELIPDDFRHTLASVRQSTSGLLRSLGSLTERDVRRPSLLPGWTIGHVLSHIARNADAMVLSLGGAMRNQPTPMYPHGAKGRDADIQAGVKRSMAEIVADVGAAVRRLDATWSEMTPQAWANDAIIRAGRLPAWQTVGARWCEVELHWVDLDTGHGPEAWSELFSQLLLRTLLQRTMIGRPLEDRLPAGIRLELFNIDTKEHWSAGPDQARTIGVHGPLWAVACWLAGQAGAALAAWS